MLQLPSYNKGLVKSVNYWPAKPAQVSVSVTAIKASFEGDTIKQGTKTRGELKQGCTNCKRFKLIESILILTI